VVDVTSDRSPPSDRATVARTVHDLVLGVVQGRTPAGVSVVIEGPPGIGKTFLVREILAAVPPGDAKVLRVVGEQGRRNEPFTAAGQLLGGLPGGGDPGEAAFDYVDELCADGPVVLSADDAHYLDAASLTLLRRLAWASQSLPLALLITARPVPSREQLAMLIRQAQVRLPLAPMGPMMVERLVFERTGRWPGPQLRRILGLAAGNPLFVAELLRAYEHAGALAEAGPDAIEARFELGREATGLAELIRAQLSQLDEPTQDVLAAMAVWGADIGPGDLAAMVSSSGEVLTELTERAISSGLVRREPAGTVGFTHDLFREVTYAELPEPRRRAAHRRAAQVLADAGYRPALVADHLLRAAGTDTEPALVTALQEAVAATRGHAPEVTADLLDDVAAIGGPGMSEPLLLDRVTALFLRGRSQAAETLIRERIAAVTDPTVAAQMQLTLIRSLVNRADTAAALAAIERTATIAALPGATLRELVATRAWLLVLAGRAPPAAQQDALMARFAAAGDRGAQASLLTTLACTAFLSGHPDAALDFMQTREGLIAEGDSFRSRSSALALPAMFELAESGPRAAQAAIDRARRLTAERHAEWVDPFLGFVAGGIAFAAGDWDGAVAELDAALELAEETNTGWISLPVGFRSYIDAHRGRAGQARARLESFRHRGLPLQFGHDRPGWAELAVLEAEGAIRAAGTLARTLWSAARSEPDRWAADLAPDVTRVAVTGMDRRLAGQLREDVPALCPPEVSRLVHGMLEADPDAIEEAATQFAGAGRGTAETFAREELACAAAAAGDRDRAVAALEAALAGYRRMGAVPDRDRALGRMRALGIRRGPREAHRDVDSGWASLTATEIRIAALVRDGLTNREIGTRLFVSPRTVQTHVSHILQKTGLRSRVEIARAAVT
jgi:DNA-binding CsgD family transcriptional regulator/tetratricopeptide (TPR) repeat protein